MLTLPHHRIYLQDGTLLSFQKKRLPYIPHCTLFHAFEKVADPRGSQGKQYPLAVILFILFFGMSRSSTTIKECYLDALNQQEWLSHFLPPLKEHVPVESVIVAAIQTIDMNSLIHECLTWKYQLYGFWDKTASFDGKTMNGIHQKEAIKHILSLFTHESHQIMGQIGVTQKENEIPAVHRLLEQVEREIEGMLLVGDALHTQIDTIEDILEKQADYLLFAKGNQETLFNDLQTFFAYLPWGSKTFEVVDYDMRGGRDVRTTITVSYEEKIRAYLAQSGWKHVSTVGEIHRGGTRTTSDGHTTSVDETYYLISSRKLTAADALKAIRGHWCIENNLHWEKDWVYLEDRQTLRSGNAPQVITFLRSFVISLFNLWSIASVTDALANFERNQKLHHIFLRASGVINYPRGISKGI